MSYIYIWGILAVVTGIIAMVFVIRKKKSTSAISYNTYLIFSIVMMCIGILTLFFKRGDNICAILFGITFLKITPVRDNREPYTIIMLRVYASSPRHQA